MKSAIAILIVLMPGVAVAQETFELGPDSHRQPGVPRGEVIQLRWADSQVFPDTERDWWIYVPAQYDDETPAALMVFQDGRWYVDETAEVRVPIVFDNLIHVGDMPVTIGVFVNPGRRIGDPSDGPARNRSNEYDVLSDRYARFLIEEIIPEVQKTYRITEDPEGWAIGGMSSGGIAAFTVAWERPDKFRKVVSHVGSFTNIRGGQRLPRPHQTERTQADPRVPARRHARHQCVGRQLVARESANG